MLGIIFTIFCTELHEYTFHIDDHPEEGLEMPAIVLSHVCKRWRAVTLSLPTLWSSIRVEFNGLPCNIDIPLRMHLKNSKPKPLRISLNFDYHDLDDYLSADYIFLSEEVKSAWDILLGASERFRELKLQLPPFDFPDIEGVSFPNLESVEDLLNEGHEMLRPPWLADDEDGPELPSEWLWDAIRAAPQLKEVTTLYYISSGYIPYAQLTTMNIADPNGAFETEEFLAVFFTQCTNLISLTWESSGDPDETEPAPRVPDSTVIPSLRYLNITKGQNNRGPFGGYFLSACASRVTFPSLRTLVFTADYWYPQLSLIAHRSSRTLEKLVVKLPFPESLSTPEHQYAIKHMVLCLRNWDLPALLEFSLCAEYHADTFGRAKIDRQSPLCGVILRTLLHKLHPQSRSFIRLRDLHISLPGMTLNSETVDSLIKVLEAHGDHLKRIQLFCAEEYKFDETMLGRTRALHERNIQLRIDQLRGHNGEVIE
ncbi:hypothetical protein V5O48_011955 [Marasmius crinis-equi]|uniref:F-box domain-containing protein n=1 Tax=Marasmius crinis-equi TaxID=585013 RepID=A0ABR3F4I7_9AGAR